MESRFKLPPAFSLTMAFVSFVVAAIPALGVVMREDTTGRLIFTAVWVLVGIAWLGGFLHSRKSQPG